MGTSTVWDMFTRAVQLVFGVVWLFFGLLSTSGFKDDGTLESTGETLLSVLCGYYWALFSYVVRGSTFSDRAGKRPNRVELLWWAQATFFKYFDCPDVSGGTIGWSRNKYLPHWPKWKQSKWYHLYTIFSWPITAFLTETKFGFTNFTARFRRDLLNPDLAQAANAPWPANAADNIWTHSIHAIVSKYHFFAFYASRQQYQFDSKLKFLEMARAQNFPVTPDLELPEGVNTVLLKKKGEGALPDGVEISKDFVMPEGTKRLYIKHHHLEMGAGVQPFNLAPEGEWEFYAIESPSSAAQIPTSKTLKAFDVGGSGNWVVQPALQNCKAVKRLCTDTAPLSTYRVVTMSTTGVSDLAYYNFPKNREQAARATTPKVVGVAFRAGRAGKMQDKLMDGAIFYGVNLKTGKIDRGTDWKLFRNNMPNEPSIETHPDTGLRVCGEEIFFKESTELCQRGHAELAPCVPIIGWDVALTDNGPLLVEANAVFLPCYSQMDKDTYVDICTTWVKWVDRNRDNPLHTEVEEQKSIETTEAMPL